MPILEKVNGGTLCLYDYNLSDVQVNALAQTSRLFQNFIRRILLDNCSVTDIQMSNLIQGCSRLRDFKSLIYRNNQFDIESAKVLGGLMLRKPPNHFEELRIVNCKISARATEIVVDTLLAKSSLEKLALVNVDFTESSIKKLSQFI